MGPPPGQRFVFMGDYGQLLLLLYTFSGAMLVYNHIYFHAYVRGKQVDRTQNGLEVLALLYSYKVLYPSQIFLLRGNHETASLTKIYGFYDECKVLI
jgi:serine/threonine-protein phosphatase PP1 catalytic subunit